MKEYGKKAIFLPLLFTVFSFNKIQQRYFASKGLVLFYERKIISKTLNLTDQIAKGVIYIKAPFFKIEQKEPEHQIVLIKGKEILWYIPSKKILYKYSIKDDKELAVLRDILTGMKDIRKDFRIVCRKDLIELIPKLKFAQIEKIALRIKDERIKEILIYNIFGSVTQFRLKKEMKRELKEDVFRISIDRDVRVRYENPF